MAIAIAKMGGMRLHRNLSVESQINEIKKVKGKMFGLAIGVNNNDLEELNFLTLMLI